MTQKELDYKIYDSVVRGIVLNEKYCSPIPASVRGKADSSPSFGIYESESGDRIMWKDLGFGGQSGYLPIHFLMDVLGWSQDKAKSYILRLSCGLEVTKVKVEIPKVPKYPPPKVFIRDTYKSWELDFWDRFWQPEKALRFFWIHPLEKMEWESGYSVTSTPQSPAFFYGFEQFNPDYPVGKMYRPNEPTGPKKFRPINVRHGIEGLEPFKRYVQVKGKVKTGVITSSTKDKQCSWVADFPALAPTGEGHYTAIKRHMKELRKLAKWWLIMMDADEAGYKHSRTVSKHSGLPFADMRGVLGSRYNPKKEQVTIIKDFGEYLDKETLHPTIRKPLGNTPAMLNKLILELLGSSHIKKA